MFCQKCSGIYGRLATISRKRKKVEKVNSNEVDGEIDRNKQVSNLTEAEQKACVKRGWYNQSIEKSSSHFRLCWILKLQCKNWKLH